MVQLSVHGYGESSRPAGPYPAMTSGRSPYGASPTTSSPYGYSTPTSSSPAFEQTLSYARTTAGYPRSPDAAAVWAAGGAGAVQDATEARYLDPANPDSLYGMMRGKQYVGIENNDQWIGEGWAPFLGYDVKAGTAGNPYQVPEYLVSDVGGTLNRMTDAELSEFRRKAIAAGLWNPDVYPSSQGITEEDIRIMSSLMSQANWSKATSWEGLLYELEQNPNADLGGAGGGADSMEPQTTIEKVYSKTSVDAGRSYIRAYMAELLGRGPSESEVTRYVGALNRMENRRPQVTESTVSMGENENTTISERRTTQNAPDVAEVLRRKVEEGNPAEKATYQAQNYFDRLMAVI